VRRARLLLGFAALGVFWGAWGAALPAVQRRSGADDAELGVALLLVGLGALVSMRATGVLIDRVGPRLTPITVAAFGASALLPAFAESPLELALFLIVLGATSGAMDVAINADAVREEIATGRPLLNLAHAAFSAAVVVASLSTGVLRWAGAGLGTIFGLSAVVVLACAFVLRSGGAPATSATGPAPRFFERVPRWLIALGCVGAASFWIESAWDNWGAVHLERSFDAGPAASALAPAFFASAMTAGRLAGNAVIARWSERRVLITGAFVAAAGSAVAAVAPTIPVALVGILAAGIGCSVLAPTVISVTGRAAAPNERATVVGSVTTLMYLGFLAGPAAVGGVAQLQTLRFSLAAVAALALVLGVLLLTVIRLPEPRPAG
jgi:MFS family permease